MILAAGAERSTKLWFSTESFGDDDKEGKNNEIEEEYDDILGEKAGAELHPQGVNPGKGWEFRGVHKVKMILSLQLRYMIVGFLAVSM